MLSKDVKRCCFQKRKSISALAVLNMLLAKRRIQLGFINERTLTIPTTGTLLIVSMTKARGPLFRHLCRPGAVGLLLSGGVFQDLFDEVIMDFGVVAQVFIVGGAQKLLSLVAQLVADQLLHGGIAEIALSGGFFSQKLHNAEGKHFFRGRVGDLDHFAVLTGLYFGDGVARGVVLL